MRWERRSWHQVWGVLPWTPTVTQASRAMDPGKGEGGEEDGGRGPGGEEEEDPEISEGNSTTGDDGEAALCNTAFRLGRFPSRRIGLFATRVAAPFLRAFLSSFPVTWDSFVSRNTPVLGARA